ncbi:hypothetical protein D3C84_987910 [compost metagenome]
MSGPCIGTAFDAKQFGLDQVVGDGRAVEGDERTIASATQLVQLAGEHLLADAGFAADQHGGGGQGHPLQGLGRGVEGSAGTNQRLFAVR